MYIYNWHNWRNVILYSNFYCESTELINYCPDVQKSVRCPVLIGSGVTANNGCSYSGANGLIIGSHFKVNGLWSNEIDQNIVELFMNNIKNFQM